MRWGHGWRRPRSCGSGGSSGGGSGSSSSSQCPGGSVTGTVTVSGAPAGFSPAYLGAGACPASTPSGVACADPTYSLAGPDGSYTLSLAAGAWEVSGFYENNAYGGVFLSAPKAVTVPSGGSVTVNFVVPYQGPATVKGMVKVTGVPTGVTIYELSALICPSFAPYTGGAASIACVNGYTQGASGSSSAPFDVTGLPPGSFTVYPSYCTEFGCETNAAAGKVVNLVSGHTTRASVKTPFILPGEGLLSATVTVTGAPTGFSDPVAATACQVGGGSCQTYTGFGTNAISMLLTDGQWVVNGLYLAAPFDNAIEGPSQTVTISGGHTTAVTLDVAYQVLGTAAGTIRVTGNQSRIPVTSYTVVACPSSVAGRSSPECVNEYSGPSGFGIGITITGAASRASGTAHTPFNLYQITTLTPGSWTLYPGYGTALGSYTDPTGTKVTIVAGQTTTQRLTVPFQVPSTGEVTGKVVVVGAPANGFQSGVEACSAPPSGLSCADGQQAYSQSDGTYALSLAPGTWWLAGFVQLFTLGGIGQSLSPAQQVTVTAGTVVKKNFTVTVAAP